ncbi:hypothetical protein, partial [Pseudomonas sp.]|uniref:hypothetical protein n=1 Tax=Pseudomonas sp. TaxID=306 RepID=UPI0028B02BF1
MSQQPLELPPTIVHPDEEDEYLPRGWGYNWDYGFHTGRFSPGINPQYLPPSVPHPQQASIDILDTLQDEIYKSHGLTYQQVVDGLDQQIDEALMHEKADPFSLDVSRSDTIERLYVEKTNLSQHYEKQAAALLGRAVDGVPSHINVADYQRLHGNPADHPEVFRQRMTEALIAAQLFWTANWQSWLYLQKIPSDQWTNVRERVAARIAARNNRAEAARIAAEAAQAEAAR